MVSVISFAIVLKRLRTTEKVMGSTAALALFRGRVLTCLLAMLLVFGPVRCTVDMLAMSRSLS